MTKQNIPMIIDFDANYEKPSVTFPNACCRCNVDAPSCTRKVKVESTSEFIKATFSEFENLQVPICKDCRDVLDAASTKWFTALVCVVGLPAVATGIAFLFLGKNSSVFHFLGCILLAALALFFWWEKRLEEPDPVNAMCDPSRPLTLIFNFRSHEYGRLFLQVNPNAKEYRVATRSRRVFR